MNTTHRPMSPRPTQPGTVVAPRCLAEAAELVRSAHRARRRLRPIGADESLSRIGVHEDLLLQTHHLQEISAPPLAMGHRADLVQVACGCRVRRLNQWLWSQGRMLENTAAFTGQTIAGAVNTASHGTGLGLPPMCDQVVSVLLVTGDGRWLRIEPSKGPTNPHGPTEASPSGEPVQLHRDDSLFASVVVGFGAFGLIAALTLRTVPGCWLREHRYLCPWSEVRAWLRDGQPLARHRHLQVLVSPYAIDGEHTACVTTRDPAQPPADGRHDARQRVVPVLFSRTPADRVLTTLMSLQPRRVPALLRTALRCTARAPIMGTGPAILDNWPLNSCAPAHATELSVHARDGVKAVDACLRLAERNTTKGHWLSAPISLRYAAPSRHLLAPQYRQASAMIEVISLRHTPWGREVLRPHARLLASLGGRPHWGLNLFTLERAADVHAAWPAAATWIAARQALDPGPAFDSVFTDRLCTPDVAEISEGYRSPRSAGTGS